MRRSSPQLHDVLTGSFSRDVTVDVWFGAERTHEGLRVESWSLAGDLGQQVKSSGRASVVYESSAGESIAPKGARGALSPFGAVLELKSRIVAGGFEEVVSLGRFKVVRVQSSLEFTVDSPTGPVVTGCVVEVEFDSLDRDIERRGFRSAEAPPSLVSCWEELRRISGFPVAVSLPDKPIPSATAWEAKQGGRLEAVQRLADLLGGVAVVDSTGALTVVPDEVGDPVLTLTVGEDGTITELGSEIDTDTVYNEVYGVFEQDGDRKPIYAVARITTGPLRVDGPYGTHTRYYSSDFVTTQAQADAAVRSVLEQSTSGQTYELQVQCHFNPLVEIGDVVKVVTKRDGGVDREVAVGRATRVDLSDDALMSVTVTVSRGL